MNLSAHSETFFHIVKKSTSLLHQQPAQLLQARRFNPITPTKKVASHCHDKILSDAKTIGAVRCTNPIHDYQINCFCLSEVILIQQRRTTLNGAPPTHTLFAIPFHYSSIVVTCCIYFSSSTIATSDRAQLICFDSRFSSVVPPAWCYNVMTQRGCNIPTVNAFPEPRKCDYNFCCDREPPLNYVWFIFRRCY